MFVDPEKDTMNIFSLLAENIEPYQVQLQLAAKWTLYVLLACQMLGTVKHLLSFYIWETIVTWSSLAAFGFVALFFCSDSTATKERAMSDAAEGATGALLTGIAIYAAICLISLSVDHPLQVIGTFTLIFVIIFWMSNQNLFFGEDKIQTEKEQQPSHHTVKDFDTDNGEATVFDN